MFNDNYFPVTTVSRRRLFFIFIYQRHNCPTRTGRLSTEISISEQSVTFRSWYSYWYSRIILKCYKYNVFFINFAKQLDNYKTTVGCDLLFQMFCSTLFCVCRRVKKWHRTPRQTVLKYSNLDYPVTYVFHSFRAATIKLGSRSPRCWGL